MIRKTLQDNDIEGVMKKIDGRIPITVKRYNSLKWQKLMTSGSGFFKKNSANFRKKSETDSCQHNVGIAGADFGK
jgi:hypothetical protein